MKLEDLPKNTCYYAEYSDKESFVIAESNSFPTKNFWGKKNINGYLEIKSYFTNNIPGAIENIRIATEEEAHWLRCCIESDSIEGVTFEEAMKSFNLKTKDDPELGIILKNLLKL